MGKTTKFFTTGSPLDYMHSLTKYLDSKEVQYKISGFNLSIKFNSTLLPVPEEDDEEEEKKADEIEGTPVSCKVSIFKCDE